MASSRTNFDDLSVPEQILHVQELWDRIAAHPERVPLSDALRTELVGRLDEHRAAPDQASPWDEARSRIRKKP